jgi:Transposase, Mutator family
LSLVFSRNGAVMTETLVTVAKKKPELTAEQVAAEELVRRAREQGLSLTGPDGLLKQLTKVMIETALDQELTEHLGHEKNTPAGNESGNVRNGSRPKTVLTEGTGQVGIEVPRDRDGTFTPQIVKKRQRRLNGVDEIVLSLYAKGLTTGEMGMYPWRRLLSWQNWASNGMKSSPWPKVTANVRLVFTSLAFMWTRHLLGEVAAPSFRPPPGMSA